MRIARIGHRPWVPPTLAFAPASSSQLTFAEARSLPRARSLWSWRRIHCGGGAFIYCRGAFAAEAHSLRVPFTCEVHSLRDPFHCEVHWLQGPLTARSIHCEVHGIARSMHCRGYALPHSRGPFTARFIHCRGPFTAEAHSLPRPIRCQDPFAAEAHLLGRPIQCRGPFIAEQRPIADGIAGAGGIDVRAATASTKAQRRPHVQKTISNCQIVGVSGRRFCCQRS